jgi:hypothetical protein
MPDRVNPVLPSSFQRGLSRDSSPPRHSRAGGHPVLLNISGYQLSPARRKERHHRQVITIIKVQKYAQLIHKVHLF